MLSTMSITQHSAYCGCLQMGTSGALRLAMGRVGSLRPTHTFMGISRDERSEGDKHEFSHNILGWLNSIANNWSSETRWKPSLP
jgi:hypothetical protein